MKINIGLSSPVLGQFIREEFEDADVAKDWMEDFSTRIKSYEYQIEKGYITKEDGVYGFQEIKNELKERYKKGGKNEN